MSIHLRAPLTEEVVRCLRAGDEVLLSGTIYTARDAAHKLLVQLLDDGEALPFDPYGQLIYYVGPCPAPLGRVIGSAGPTTSGRMDIYAPRLIELGLRGMIGKGNRSADVIDSMKQHGAVYFHAIGGAGAYIANCVQSVEVIAFPELGPEALCKIEVENFPVFVAIDADGHDMYKQGRDQFEKTMDS